MYHYIFRVDSGNIPELGTGHLFRCINIYKYLIKNKINKKKILFITKTKGKYKTSKIILEKLKINYISINREILDFSREEQLYLENFKSKVIIFDRMSKINNLFLSKLRKQYKKIIGIDIIVNKKSKIDLLVNPLNNKLNLNKKLKNYKNNILPSLENKKNFLGKNKNKNIFTFFGGYDHNRISKKILKLKIPNTKFIIPKSKNKFYELMNKSDIVLCSGGLTVFDAIYLNKVIIAVPQYHHQFENLRILKKNGIIFICKLSINFKKEIKKIIENCLNITYAQKLVIFNKQKKIISKNSQLKILKKIYDAHI